MLFLDELESKQTADVSRTFDVAGKKRCEAWLINCKRPVTTVFRGGARIG